LGIHLFDNCDLEDLSKVATERKRWSFMLTAAPLAVPGGTGSPLNPVATFLNGWPKTVDTSDKMHLLAAATHIDPDRRAVYSCNQAGCRKRGSCMQTKWLCVSLLAFAPLFAQSTDAIVSGTIVDPTGAIVSDAAVSAKNLDTGVVTSTVTNESGLYRFPPLPPGRYDFTVEHAGFRKAITAGVTLEAAARLTLNKQLDLGSTADSVQVDATVAGLTLSTATVGGTVEGRRLQDLPITGRDAMNFLYTQAGIGSVGTGFNGTRSGALNVTTDGIATLSNRIDGINTTGIVTSSGLLGTTAFQSAARVDRVEQVRIVTSPADVEYGRGMGQLQLVTRSGSNNFHGSVFEEHRDTVLNANNWFGNAAGTNPITGQKIQPRQILVSNQYGGRIGGPIKRNKTFFNFYYEGQRQIEKRNIVANVLTSTARQGIFRFYPGALNSNAASSTPTVDLQGNPVQPTAATGPLQSASVFGLDPNRMQPDSSGVIATNLAGLPLPNYFLVGDGLNTAGYAWQTRIWTHFDTFEGRIDHNFSENERLQVSYNHIGFNTLQPSTLPTSPNGLAPTSALLATVVLNSVLRPNLLNEVRIGVHRPQIEVISPYDIRTGGPDALFKAKNGSPYLISPLTFSPVIPIDSALDGYANVTPNYQYGDNVTWIKGRHSFKGGFEARFISYAGYDIANVVPRAFIGIGNTPVTGLTAANVPGIGANLGTAQSLLLDLSGSVGSVTQTLNAPSGSSTFLPGLTRYALIKQHEYSGYFKDDFKIIPSLTLNLGVRYELYRVPYEGDGNMVVPVGGGYSLFGISGNSYAAEFKPGLLNGQLITPQQIGPNGPHPDISLHNGDHNNFGPGIGLAWSLPWFGKDRTVFRAGYGVGYERTAIYVTQLETTYAPGLGQTFVNTPSTFTNLTNVSVPVTPTNAPLQQIPLNSNPFSSRQLTFSTFDPNIRTPYIQNWSASITRTLPGNAMFEVRYVGTKGTKLLRGTNVNETNVIENGIAAAFNQARVGGDSPLLNQIFGRYAPSGQTGSQFVLTSTATQGFFSRNDVGGFASLINNSQVFTPGVPGGLLLNAGLPQNFVTVSPQYATEYLQGNSGGSTYHSLQIEYAKRFSAGFSAQSNFVWNRYLGDYNAGDDSGLTNSFRTLRDKNIDKALLDRKFFWRTNGLWELPFGPGKLVGRNTHGALAKAIGGWQVGSIFNVFSGFPISFGMIQSTFNTVAANNLANLSGPVPQGTVQKVGTGVAFFGDYRQVIDPQVATLTTTGNVRAISPLRAITDASGNVVLSNALPGTMGNMAPGMGFGPGYFQFDMNLLKKVRLTEKTELQLGANATNILNTPQFSAPSAANMSIDITSFGRITSTVTPNRVIVLTGRISF
jgi:hypothetical protein